MTSATAPASSAPNSAAPNTVLPPGIEAFRAGRHVDDAGGVHEFSEADIDAIAAAYDPALREAPLVVGHPAANAPAYGWVAAARAAAGELGRVLLIDSRDVEPAFAEMVARRRFPKRSSSFYPPQHPNNPTPGRWYLRHVGFLGAQPPAVPGLKDIQFSEGDDGTGVVSFSESSGDDNPTQEPSMDKDDAIKQQQQTKLQADLDAEKAAREKAEAEARTANEKLAQFAEAQRRDRHAAHVSFAEVAFKAGKLNPADKATAIAVLDQLAEAQVVEFAEGETTRKVAPAEFVKSLIEAAAPLVQFGEFAPAGSDPAPRDRSDAEIDQAARRYATQHNVSYSEALDKVVGFTA